MVLLYIVYDTATCRRSSNAQIQAHTRLNLVSKHGVLVPCSRVELPKPLAVDVKMAIAVDSARQLELASRPDNAQHLDRALHVLHELLVRLLACLALLWQGQPPVQYLVECHACGLRNKSEVRYEVCTLRAGIQVWDRCRTCAAHASSRADVRFDQAITEQPAVLKRHTQTARCRLRVGAQIANMALRNVERNSIL